MTLRVLFIVNYILEFYTCTQTASINVLLIAYSPLLKCPRIDVLPNYDSVTTGITEYKLPSTPRIVDEWAYCSLVKPR